MMDLLSMTIEDQREFLKGRKAAAQYQLPPEDASSVFLKAFEKQLHIQAEHHRRRNTPAVNTPIFQNTTKRENTKDIGERFAAEFAEAMEHVKHTYNKTRAKLTLVGARQTLPKTFCANPTP